jgi:hypothetical protein
MSCVFQNIDPPPPTARRVCTPPPLVRGEDTVAGWRGGWGVNILEDARHSSVLYICKYIVVATLNQNLFLTHLQYTKDGESGVKEPLCVESLVDDNIDLTPSKPKTDVSAEKKSAEKKSAKKKKQEKNSPGRSKAAASQPPAKSGNPPAKVGNPPAKAGNPLARFLVKLQPGQTVGEKKGATKAAAAVEEDDIQIIENDPKKEPEQAGREKMDVSSADSKV